MKKFNKIFNTIISLMLALALMMSFAACGEGDGDDDEITNGSITKELVYEDGVHEGLNPEDLDDYFIRDGECDYVIVIPKVCDNEVRIAKDEFNLLFKRATGFALKYVTDDKVETFNQNQKYISIGYTTLLEEAGITPEQYTREELKTQGYKIKTVGKSVFLYASFNWGFFNAVYKFMSINFNYKFFTANCLTIDTEVKEKKLKNFNVTDVPDIDNVTFQGSSIMSTSTAVAIKPGDVEALGATAYDDLQMRKYRYRMFPLPSYYYAMSTHMRKLESDVAIYPISQYGIQMSSNLHNEFVWADNFDMDYINAWYASDRMGVDRFPAPTVNEVQMWRSQTQSDRLCYTAHGDEDAYEAMLDHFANKVIYSMKVYNKVDFPLKNELFLTENDSYGTCMCNACQAIYSQCGNAFVSTTVLFANELMERVEIWMAEQEALGDPYNALRDDFSLIIMPYNKITAPPTYYDETSGEYVPYTVNGEKIMLHKYVGYWHVEGYADGRFDGYTDVLNVKNQVGFDEEFGWLAVSNPEYSQTQHKISWNNSGHTNCGFYFDDSLSLYSRNYWILKAICDFDTVFCASPYSGGAIETGWRFLLFYVCDQLRWDCTQDTSKLVDEYFDAMYGPASVSMRALYDAMVNHWSWIMSELLSRGSYPNRGSQIKQSTKYWPYQATSQWVNLVNKAYDDIAYLKSDNPNLHATYDYRIQTEEICVLYTIIYTYESATQRPFTDAQFKLFKSRLADCISWTGCFNGLKNLCN